MEINNKAPVRASAEIVIDAPEGMVWEVLSDIRNWPEWNPSVSRANMYGELEPGTDFHWKADGVSVVSVLQVIEPGKRLGWTGRSPGIRAAHLWEFEQSEGQTRVRTCETFEGLLARFFSGPLTRLLNTTLSHSLAALKQECERRAEASPNP